MSIAAVLLLSVVRAQDAAQANINDWIFALGAEEIETRERAERELLRIGTPAVLSLRKAAGDADLERASRARTILARIDGKKKPSEEKPPRTLRGASDDESDGFWFQDPSSGRVLRFRVRHLSLFDSWFWPFWNLAESTGPGG